MLLPWLVLVPLIAAVVCFLLPEKASRFFALAVSLVGTALGVCLYVHFDGAKATELQMAFSLPWIHSLAVHFGFAVDGISFPLVVLTKFMVPVALVASWHEKRHVQGLMAAFLTLDAAMTGTFLATDIFLFYVFWELMLIPMILIIGIWGSQDRIYASSPVPSVFDR